MVCCDASVPLSQVYQSYEQVAGFSATLKPFEYYIRLSGLQLESFETAEFPSPFDPRRRKILIVPQISTKYADRERNYARIAEAVRRISELKPGNYFIFVPSFDFLSRLLEVFDPPQGFTVLSQAREMSASEVKAFIDYLKSCVTPTLIFAVQGGVFSEGVDYPGEALIGVFVVGTALPAFNLEREQMKVYYQKTYGTGFDYAYTFPAMAKAIQAAGRVIRTETDRGLIVLLDHRFLHPSYAASMPEDWLTSEQPLVSQAILKDVRQFWSTALQSDGK